MSSCIEAVTESTLIGSDRWATAAFAMSSDRFTCTVMPFFAPSSLNSAVFTASSPKP